MEEKWERIPDTEYEISNLGRCRGIERYVRTCGNGKRLVKSKIIKPTLCTNGYLEYQLPISSQPNKKKVFMAHRLVAQAFIPNPENKPEVNHLDENPLNNKADNLCWVTPKENCNYGSRNLKCRECNRDSFKPVKQLTKSGDFIKEYECIQDAAKELGIRAENISRAARKVANRKYCKGYMWEFVK